MSILRLFRPINLAIILLTQGLVVFRFGAALPAHWYCWTIGTVLVAAAGYVVNDIFDVAIDQINKPARRVVGVRLSVRCAYWVYAMLNAAAIGVGLWASPVLLAELVSIALLLYGYARWFKKMPLLGNVVVAMLSAYSVVFPLRSAESLSWNFQLVFFCFFAFSVSLFREIAKTIEDIAGDRVGCCRTLPICIGEPATKKVLYVLVAAMLVFLGYSWVNYSPTAWHYAYYVCIVWQLLFLSYLTYKAHTSAAYHRVSSFTKVLMLLGIMGLFL